jgi:hypothetical protein
LEIHEFQRRPLAVPHWTVPLRRAPLLGQAPRSLVGDLQLARSLFIRIFVTALCNGMGWSRRRCGVGEDRLLAAEGERWIL